MGEPLRFDKAFPMGSERRREAVYRDGEFVGEIVYVARRRKARGHELESSATGYVTEYGWRPDGWRYSNNARLTDRTEAAARLRSVA